MKNHFLLHFITVLGLHLALIFGGIKMMQEEALSSVSISPNRMKLQIATRLKPKEEPKKKLKKVAKKPKVEEEKKPVPPPKEEVKISDEIVEKTIISSKSTQEINDIRTLYKAQLRSKIEENKFYPTMSRRLGQQGTVVVAFTLLKDGNIIDIKLESPSQYERLNASALEAVRKVKRFMPIPNELGENRLDIRVPLKFFTI